MVTDGSVPLFCPVCSDAHRIHKIDKQSFEFLSHEQESAFKHYQYINKDYRDGAYGRFMAERCGLPSPPEDIPLWDNIEEIFEEMGWKIK